MDLREINIKYDKPSASDAIKRVTFYVHDSKQRGVKILKIIHGYGSTGKGGVIRKKTHEYLQSLKERNVIKDWVAGDYFTIFDERVQIMLRTCDALRHDHDLERHNNGVTFVLL